ncbi:uncharacterized protein LOC129949387 [Eupeodes corollae]|uniref:uncharacterized protein LOC129949387 n=1 Tax=Eupeodes corollae TaxID=290404 RepID=UPI00249266FA|nr:uncharacterized protein LOC129949387 [Eupeodes corollae]
MDAGKNFLSEFIDCYELCPSLWDNSSPEYTSRHTKFIAYNKLLNIMKKYKEDASITDVKKKINTLRSNFRREMKRISRSEARGDMPLYTPNLWWFEKFSFLRHLKNFKEYSKSGSSKANIHAKQEEVYIDEYSMLDEHDDNEDDNEEDEEQEHDPVYSMDIKLEDTTKSKRQHIAEEPYIEPMPKKIKTPDDNLLVNYNVLPTPSTASEPPAISSGVSANATVVVPVPDTIDHMCKAWAGNLREMTKSQRIIAERAISEIIFQGQVGVLTFDSIPKMPVNASSSSSQMQMVINSTSSQVRGTIDPNEYSTQQQQQQSHHMVDHQNQVQHQQERLSTTSNLPQKTTGYTTPVIKQLDYPGQFYDQ